VFPDKEARRSLTRFKKGFYFVTAEVKANVVDSQRDAESFGSLTEVWVRAFGIPSWAKQEKVARQLAFLVGEPVIVDKASLAKPKWVRIKVAVKRPDLANGVNGVFINGQGYYIRWEVEGEYAPPPPSTDPDNDEKDRGRNGGEGNLDYELGKDGANKKENDA
jgi:hypothetical protein